MDCDEAAWCTNCLVQARLLNHNRLLILKILEQQQREREQERYVSILEQDVSDLEDELQCAQLQRGHLVARLMTMNPRQQ